MSGSSRSSLELEVFGGAGRENGVDGWVSLVSSQASAASSAGCENLSDLNLVTGHRPVFRFEIGFWPKEHQKSIQKKCSNWVNNLHFYVFIIRNIYITVAWYFRRL